MRSEAEVRAELERLAAESAAQQLQYIDLTKVPEAERLGLDGDLMALGEAMRCTTTKIDMLQWVLGD